MRFFEPWGQGGERETGDVRVSEKTRRHQLESSLPSCTNLSFCLPNNPGPSATAEFLCPHMHTVSDALVVSASENGQAGPSNVFATT